MKYGRKAALGFCAAGLVGVLLFGLSPRVDLGIWLLERALISALVIGFVYSLLVGGLNWALLFWLWISRRFDLLPPPERR